MTSTGRAAQPIRRCLGSHPKPTEDQQAARSPRSRDRPPPPASRRERDTARAAPAESAPARQACEAEHESARAAIPESADSSAVGRGGRRGRPRCSTAAARHGRRRRQTYRAGREPRSAESSTHAHRAPSTRTRGGEGRSRGDAPLDDGPSPPPPPHKPPPHPPPRQSRFAQRDDRPSRCAERGRRAYVRDRTGRRPGGADVERRRDRRAIAPRTSCRDEHERCALVRERERQASLSSPHGCRVDREPNGLVGHSTGLHVASVRQEADRGWRMPTDSSAGVASRPPSPRVGRPRLRSRL